MRAGCARLCVGRSPLDGACRSWASVIERSPVAGDLLVASVLLADGVFNQSVVLILDFDADGALGVIVNEISQLPLDAVLA